MLIIQPCPVELPLNTCFRVKYVADGDSTGEMLFCGTRELDFWSTYTAGAPTDYDRVHESTVHFLLKGHIEDDGPDRYLVWQNCVQVSTNE